MDQTSFVSIESLLQRKPGVNGGRVCLAGTGISVRQIAVWYNAGRRPDQILEDYPSVDLARIYAAITCYLANKDLMDAEMATDEADFQAAKRASMAPANA